MKLVAEHIDIGHAQSVLGPLDFSLTENGLLALIGRNGVGKSTLLKTLAGLIPAVSGVIRLAGRPLHEIAIGERAKLLAFVPSAIEGAGAMKVMEYVSLGRLPHLKSFGRFSKEDERLVVESMEHLGVTRFARRPLAELSDGERQKVAIARALAQQTSVILLDEPTAFLDVSARVEVIKHLARLSQKALIVFSTHDISMACQLSGQIMVLDRKEGVLIDSPKNLQKSGALDSIFQGNGVNITYPDYGIRIKDGLSS